MLGPPVDYVLGVDPGYATQGACLLTVDGTVRRIFASITDPALDNHHRCLLQVQRLCEITAEYGPNGLLVIEEFHARKNSKASPTSVYNRGWYDALVRGHFIPSIAHAITVHSSAVHTWSGPPIPTGKRKNQPKPTPEGILAYIRKTCPWLTFPDPSTWTCFEYDDCGVCRQRVKMLKAPLMHPTDALVMAAMGYVAYVRPELSRGRPPHQQAWVQSVAETYEFTDPSQGCR